MRNAFVRRLTLCAVALTLAACGQQPRKDSAPATVPPSTEIAETGWLDADTAEGPGIVFRDDTSRETTYPAGRFMYATPVDSAGNTILDFNRAFNPPCAFTAFATCPLPPAENVVKVAIAAGEKRYAGPHGSTLAEIAQRAIAEPAKP